MMRLSKLLRNKTKTSDGISPGSACRMWFGAFLGIAGLGFVDLSVPDGQDSFVLTSAFGASAVLVFGNRRHFYAQPRSLIGGHVFSAIVGVLSFKILHEHPWLAAGIGTAGAIAVMQLSNTLHPPGAATALFAVIGPGRVHDIGFLYVIAPVGAGALLLLCTALAVNNIASERRYPEFWLFPGS